MSEPQSGLPAPAEVLPHRAPFLFLDAVTALESALAATPGEPIQINGMLRSLPQQLLLYRWFTSGSCAVIGASASYGCPAARPIAAFRT